jgi:hypothetical protein
MEDSETNCKRYVDKVACKRPHYDFKNIDDHITGFYAEHDRLDTYMSIKEVIFRFNQEYKNQVNAMIIHGRQRKEIEILEKDLQIKKAKLYGVGNTMIKLPNKVNQF